MQLNPQQLHQESEKNQQFVFETRCEIHYQRRCLHRHTHMGRNLPLPDAFSELCPTYCYNRHQPIHYSSLTTR